MDKEKSNQAVHQAQSTTESLNVACSRVSSGSSSPNSNQLPLFSVHPSPMTETLTIDSNGQVTCSKCNCTMDYCNCDPPSRNRQKACSLTLESENTFINYANNQLKNTYPYHEAKRSLSVSVPSKRKQNLADKHLKYGEHLNLINVNICSEASPTTNQCLRKQLQTPSIHISENPLSNNAHCTCTNLNQTAKLKADKHQFLCLIHQATTDHHLASPHHQQIYNSQNQYLTNANGQQQFQAQQFTPTSFTSATINQLSNQINQLMQPNQSNQSIITAHHHQRNSIQSIPLNLINTPSKTPSKESIFAQSDFNSPHTCLPPIESPSAMSTGKCESVAHSIALSHQQHQALLQQQADQTPKRPSFANLSPQNAISNSSTSNNLMAHARQDRLFSVGLSFHIQFKHPNAYGWQQRTGLEKKLIIIIIVVFFSFLFITAGSHLLRTYISQKNQVCMSVECVKTASSLLSAMDLTSDPCHDFFNYACGNWNKMHIISDDRSSISTFEVMADNLQVILKGLLEEPVSSQEDNSATIKAKVFFKSCMKIEKIEEIHDQPLRELIQDLGGWLNDWIPSGWKKEELLARLRLELNQGMILEMWVGPDDKNSTAHIIQIDQMALGLPSREYYLKHSSKKERDAYLKLMVELAVLLDSKRDYASKEMRKVLDFEIKLANASMPEADRHDTGSIYRKLTVRELQSIVKEFDWLLYFNKILPIKIDLDEPIVVYSLNYLLEIGKILEQTEKKVIHNYVIWRLVRNLTPYLAGEYVQKRIDFRKVLLGVSAERVRWIQCVEMVNKRLGMAVGALFIKSHFDPNAKKTALEMIQNIREAFNEILDENDWMNEQTKIVAKKKANGMNERIGYPNFLTNAVELSNEYIQLQVHEDQFLLNILNLLKFEANKNLAKLRKPVDKDRWTTEPAVVNAFYNPNKNDIVFPAGILQPFFYSAHFPKSLNYGAIGVVIGHEITHGFDNKGRQFDKDGNMQQWWENSTIIEFQKRAQCIIDQYSSFVLEEVGLNINGKMTNGENIADNGGLKAAYRAFKKFEAKHDFEPLLPGLNMSHDQLFFLNYAQIWCGTMRPQQQLTSIRSSVHSPGPIRVLGPLSNSVDFSKAFQCELGTRMNPRKKCQIW